MNDFLLKVLHRFNTAGPRFHLCSYQIARFKIHLFDEFLTKWDDQLRKYAPSFVTIRLEKEIAQYKVCHWSVLEKSRRHDSFETTTAILFLTEILKIAMKPDANLDH